MTDLLLSWVRAECKFREWQDENPVMARKLRGNFSGISGFANWRADVGWCKEDGRPMPLVFIPGGLEVDTAENANSDESLAYDLFAVFLFTAAPHAEVRICDRCRRFYWNRWGHRNKRFCRRKCSQLQTAIEGRDKRLGAERGEKNRRIRQSIKSFINLKPQNSEWRRWGAKDAGVTLNYLTRAINRGAQSEPDGVKITRMQAESIRKIEKGEKP